MAGTHSARQHEVGTLSGEGAAHSSGDRGGIVTQGNGLPDRTESMSRVMGTIRKTRMNRGRKRPVAGREEILSAARAIGVRKGWEAVTIRSVAQKLGYTSPLLYEHFRDKQDLLTQLAVEAIAMFEKELTADLPADHSAAAMKMAERYWTFMLEHKQLYRLAMTVQSDWADPATTSLSIGTPSMPFANR